MSKQSQPRRPGLAWLAAVGTLAALAAGLAAAAVASQDAGIVPISRSNRGATNLARSIVQGEPKLVQRAKFVTIPPGAKPVAMATKRLNAFPRTGGAFAILSTGCAPLADNPNTNGNTGCRNGGVKTKGARDVVIWRIRLRVPRGANCLSFRFKFLSEEYPEWVDSRYNDAFVAEVGRAPDWNAGRRRDPTVTAPRDFARTRDGRLITVSGTGVARVSRAAARGTAYDAATGLLRASTRVRSGHRLLYLSLFDQGDRQYDSAVFIDRLLARHAAKCRSGVVPYKGA